MSEVINLNNTSPAALTGTKNVTWQKGAQTGVDPATGLGIFPVSAAFDATQTIGLVLDGGLTPPTTGPKGFIRIPFACTITQWSLLADQSGSAQITIYKSTYAAFVGASSGSSIVAAAAPNLTAAVKNTDSTLTGWTTAIAAGDVLLFNLDSVATCVRLVLELQVTRS